MDRYAILTNSRRAMVALVHSAVFLVIAARGVVSSVRPLHTTSPASDWMMFTIFLVVSTILLLLTAYARGAIERLYFALCTTSAGSGLFRSVFGDPRMHAAVYVRVVMLAGAVVIGTRIWRAHSLTRAPAAKQA